MVLLAILLVFFALVLVFLVALDLWWSRPSAAAVGKLRRFDLASLLTATTAVALACATHVQLGWPLALITSCVICWLVKLFLTELLAATNCGADRSRLRDYRERSDKPVAVPEDSDAPATKPSSRLKMPKLRVRVGGVFFKR